MVTDDPGKLPSWAQRYLHSDAIGRVEAAVRAAEKTTSGEIVPMVVASSAVTGHVLPLLATLLVCADVAIEALLSEWTEYRLDPMWGGIRLLVLVIIAFPLSRLAVVRRWLTPSHDLEAQVMRRAALEFYQAGLNRTAEATGILLFTSLAERRAVVLADQSIAERLPSEAWTEVIGLLLGGIRRGDLGQGFVEAIEHCGRLVSPHFPARPGDINELADALVVKP